MKTKPLFTKKNRSKPQKQQHNTDLQLKNWLKKKNRLSVRWIRFLGQIWFHTGERGSHNYSKIIHDLAEFATNRHTFFQRLFKRLQQQQKKRANEVIQQKKQQLGFTQEQSRLRTCSMRTCKSDDKRKNLGEKTPLSTAGCQTRLFITGGFG